MQPSNHSCVRPEVLEFDGNFEAEMKSWNQNEDVTLTATTPDQSAVLPREVGGARPSTSYFDRVERACAGMFGGSFERSTIQYM